MAIWPKKLSDLRPYWKWIDGDCFIPCEFRFKKTIFDWWKWETNTQKANSSKEQLYSIFLTGFYLFFALLQISVDVWPNLDVCSRNSKYENHKLWAEINTKKFNCRQSLFTRPKCSKFQLKPEFDSNTQNPLIVDLCGKIDTKYCNKCNDTCSVGSLQNHIFLDEMLKSMTNVWETAVTAHNFRSMYEQMCEKNKSEEEIEQRLFWPWSGWLKTNSPETTCLQSNRVTHLKNKRTSES